MVGGGAGKVLIYLNSAQRSSSLKTRLYRKWDFGKSKENAVKVSASNFVKFP